MKLFGQFLIEKGLINEQDLLNALLVQIQKTPSHAEIIFENKWLSNEEILNILEKQSVEHLDFKTAAVRLNIWNAELESNVTAAIQKRRPPLGRLLSAEGLISLPDLTQSLDEFVSIYIKQRKDSPPPATPMLDNAKFAKVDYVDFFDVAKKNKLNELADSLSLQTATQLIMELHTVKGCARYSGAKLSELLISQAELIVEFLVRDETQFDQLFQVLHPPLRKSLEMIWDLRQAISDSPPENANSPEGPLEETAMDHYNQLKETLNELQNRERKAVK